MTFPPLRGHCCFNIDLSEQGSPSSSNESILINTLSNIIIQQFEHNINYCIDPVTPEPGKFFMIRNSATSILGTQHNHAMIL